MSTAAFTDAFVRWRFGEPGAGGEAIDLGRGLLAEQPYREDAGLLHLRLAMLLKFTDPDDARASLREARARGVVIPRELAGPDETGSPHPTGETRDLVGIETTRVRPPSTRSPWPIAFGDRRPGFHLAATQLPPLDLSVLQGGLLSVDVTRGLPQVYVFDSEGRLAHDLSTGPAPFLDDPVSCEGPLVLLDDVFGGFNVCHALFDKLPRLALYEDRFPGQVLSAAFFVNHPYYSDVLTALGHRLAVPPGPRWTVSADQLAVLSNHRRGEVMHPAFSGADWAVDFIRETFQATSPGTRRLYVSREDAAVRRLVNEGEVRRSFVARGFEVQTLTGLSFQEQRALFQGASHIAGVHGAGLANQAFAHPTTRVLEIMPPLAGTFAYWVMAGALGQPYGVIAADDAELTVRPGASYDPSLGERALRLPLERLSSALDWFC